MAAPRRVPLRLLAAVGLVAAAVPLALGVTYDGLTDRSLRVLLVEWVVVPYVLAGLVAAWRRPANGFGPLLVAAGAAMSASTLQWTAQPVAYTVGQLCDLLVVPVFAHVFLAYPTGRIPEGPVRALVAAGYAGALGLSTVVLLLGGFDPRNLLALTSAADAAETVQNVQLVALALLCVAALGVLLGRRRAARGAPRRRTTLLVDAFGVGLVMLAALLVAGMLGLPGFDALRLVTFGTLGLAPVAFLAGLLDARLARSEIGELLVELHSDPAPDLRTLLARTLRDPSLALAYWIPQYETWADDAGEPVVLAEAADGRAVALVERDGRPVAALLYDPALEEETELVRAVCAAVGIALENGQLQAELQARLHELRGSRARVVEAGRLERQRLERNLHDGAQQRLVALSLELGLLESELAADPAARERLQQARTEVATSLDELRALARGLHPAVVSAHGLAVALESLTARAPVPVALDVRLPGRLPEPVEVTAYYVVSECLANTGKHARASQVDVRVALDGPCLVVEVTDDGSGGADAERGSGLRGLADRVESLGGRLQVRSRRGVGTRVRAEVPCG